MHYFFPGYGWGNRDLEKLGDFSAIAELLRTQLELNPDLWRESLVPYIILPVIHGKENAD